MICQNCKAELEENEKFCGECGTPVVQPKEEVILEVQENVCSNCGVELEDNEKFCHECGTSLERDKTEKIKTKEKVDSSVKDVKKRKNKNFDEELAKAFIYGINGNPNSTFNKNYLDSFKEFSKLKYQELLKLLAERQEGQEGQEDAAWFYYRKFNNFHFPHYILPYCKSVILKTYIPILIYFIATIFYSVSLWPLFRYIAIVGIIYFIFMLLASLLTLNIPDEHDLRYFYFFTLECKKAQEEFPNSRIKQIDYLKEQGGVNITPALIIFFIRFILALISSGLFALIIYLLVFKSVFSESLINLVVKIFIN